MPKAKGTRHHQEPEGKEQPAGLPGNVKKLDGRWFGDATLSIEGVSVNLIFSGVNKHTKNGRFSSHSHPFCELLYTLSGEADVTCDGVTLPMTEGQVCVAAPGMGHASEWHVSAHTSWVCLVLDFDITIDADELASQSDVRLAHSIAPFYQYFLLGRKRFHLLGPALRKTVRSSADHLFGLLAAQPEVGHVAIASFWLMFFAAVSRSLQEAGLATGRGVVLELSPKELNLIRAKALLSRETEGETDIGKTAQLVGMSKYDFIRSFHRMFGIPPQRYRAGIILDRAANLLRQTDRSVEEITEEVGYSSASSLSRAFRRKYGVSPSIYRQAYSENGHLASHCPSSKGA